MFTKEEKKVIKELIEIEIEELEATLVWYDLSDRKSLEEHKELLLSIIRKLDN